MQHEKLSCNFDEGVNFSENVLQANKPLAYLKAQIQLKTELRQITCSKGS